MATRRKYSPEFKHEAVQMARSSEQSMSQVARDLGIVPNLLTRWCREAAADGVKAFPGQGQSRCLRLHRTVPQPAVPAKT